MPQDGYQWHNSICELHLSGGLTRDAELVELSNGVPKLSFSVAYTRTAKKGEQYVPQTNYIDCVMFGGRAKALKPLLLKGTKVTFVADLVYQSWMADDQKRSKHEAWIMSHHAFEFMSGRRDAQQAQAPQQVQAPAAQQTQQQYYAPQQYAQAPMQQPYAQTDIYGEEINF